MVWKIILFIIFVIFLVKGNFFYNANYTIEPFYEFQVADNITIPEMFALSDQHMHRIFNCNHINTPRIGSLKGSICR